MDRGDRARSFFSSNLAFEGQRHFSYFGKNISHSRRFLSLPPVVIFQELPEAWNETSFIHEATVFMSFQANSPKKCVNNT